MQDKRPSTTPLQTPQPPLLNPLRLPSIKLPTATTLIDPLRPSFTKLSLAAKMYILDLYTSGNYTSRDLVKFALINHKACAIANSWLVRREVIKTVMAIDPLLTVIPT
ncbi:hypothetical protein HK097_005894, partial [Rhizophlyctis rosea]